MGALHVWPSELPPGLDRLHAAVAEALGLEATPLTSPADLHGGDGSPNLALLVLGADEGDEDPVRAISELASDTDLALVVVVGDGYLGTDVEDLRVQTAAAGAIAAVRSLAVRRGGRVRPNAVCVPDALLGRPGSQRGPLRHEVDVTDVANAVAYLLGEEGSYVRGQVLFVNGGRHLFSSLTA